MDAKEFRVNKFITLRLEGNETIIYVDGKRFDQCKLLLLDISLDEAYSLDTIESIDEAAERLDKSLDPYYRPRIKKITPEEEFWGHCSNLQVWYEENYNTNIIHSNLAFPLLKKLSEIGDSLAKKVFKEEIAKRLSSRNLNTVKFLLEGSYYNYLTPEEFDSFFRSLTMDKKELIKSFLLEKFSNIRTSYEEKDNVFNYMEVACSEAELLNYPYIVSGGRKAFMKEGTVSVKYVKNLSDIEGLRDLIGLKQLIISQQSLNCIEGLENLTDLEILNLNRNKIKHITGLDKLTNLRVLDLSFNDIEKISGLENLKKLEDLYLSSNRITEIKGLESLYNLKKLDLSS
ncbi:MAG: leucine-rich repeat domain-containing protein, partial [Candidatus Odinarchaeota archaeon]